MSHTAYTISISEAQRQLLVQVLANYATLPGSAHHNALAAMLASLPAEETHSQALGHAPGATVHGFAL